MTLDALRIRSLQGATLLFAGTFVVAGGCLAASTPAPAPTKAAASAKAGGPSMLPGAGSHEPINIQAGRLDYYDKEQKLIYTGSVVAVQGDSTLKASVLTIFLSKDQPQAGAPASAEESTGASPPGAGSSVKHMEAAGPVTLISKDQIGTGDKASYDKDKNIVTMTGNVTLTQGPNVTRGDRLVYDMTSGQAQVFGTRVISIFTPNSTPPGDAPSGPKKKPPVKAKPSQANAQ